MKMAASKFNLKTKWGGGFHTSLLDCTTGLVANWSYVCRYSFRNSAVLLFR